MVKGIYSNEKENSELSSLNYPLLFRRQSVLRHMFMLPERIQSNKRTTCLLTYRPEDPMCKTLHPSPADDFSVLQKSLTF